MSHRGHARRRSGLDHDHAVIDPCRGARLNPTGPAALDRAVEELRDHREAWARLPAGERLGLLSRIRPRVAAVADRWVAAALRAKGIAPESPWAGEEWIGGPYALLHGLNALVRVLERVAAGRSPLREGMVRVDTRGRTVVDVFPGTGWDRALFHGIRAEVWMQPGVTPERVRAEAGLRYRRPPPGKVALVLGAGNAASIAPLDVVHRLWGEGHVALLKLNPVNDYLGPFLEEVFGELVERGFVRFAYGGAPVGARLAAHPGVEEVHVTGSERTYRALVEETGGAKPISAELGGAGPTLVVPGPWTAADLAYQAEHIASQKLWGGGFTCVASQVLVTPRDWPLRTALLDGVREVLRALPARASYYPGTAERHAAALAAHPGAEVLGRRGEGALPAVLAADLDPQADAHLFREEVFGPVMGETALPGRTAAAFLAEAAAFVNGRLRGNLGATLLVHPRTMAELGPALRDAIAALRYGAVSVNGWVAMAFALTEATWGGFPEPDGALGSGRGLVHDAYGLEGAERSVTWAPFQPFPRSLARGRLELMPKPPWFLGHRNAADLCRRLARFAASPGLRHLPGLLVAGLRA